MALPAQPAPGAPSHGVPARLPGAAHDALLVLTAAGAAATTATGADVLLLVAAWAALAAALTVSVRGRRSVGARLAGALSAAAEAGERALAHGQDLESARAAREALAQDMFRVQRDAAQAMRERAELVVTEISGMAVHELSEVVTGVEAVREAAATIDERVTAAETITASVSEEARGTDRVVAALEESLRNVGGMAHMISRVADQTKLLALNATIEAARAGEAGKGFGVVADEVKALAEETARSTDQITQTVGSLGHDAQALAAALVRMSEGVAHVEGATGSLRAIAAEQHALVARLDNALGESIGSLQAMDSLSSRLERRGAQRVAVSGPATVVVGGAPHTVDLLDISATGARCTAPAGVGEGTALQLQVHVQGAPEVSIPSSVVRVLNRDGGKQLALDFTESARSDRTVSDVLGALTSGAQLVGV
ncbi:methyl-accepting chemotaxis protein [Kineococcus xinjiangensis]|uniref:Methyl-accepting chemotaxis protein n=1 Tax=Kineococcus xinjiangensis TaxID=512762 RepID=A0A2S6IE38_9ACTN|nr:methyl-accepting chemotaxis protein [Kineococcus xinjiangensis]PPK92482.1 methyl-accepting chemotaxis protein [Kineococcus xinjiangensis]